MGIDKGQLEIEPVGEHAVVLALSGDWSAAEVDNLVACAAEAVAGRKRSIVVDLRELTFVDSKVLAALLEIHKAALESAWSFALVRPHDEAIWRSFQVTGLAHRIPSFDSRAAALLGSG